MKTPFNALILIAGLTAIGYSCKKDDATTPTVSNDEAAYAVGEMVAADFSTTAGDAVVLSTKDASHANGRVAQNGRSLATSCGVIKDTTVTRASAGGALITYAWTGIYDYTMACDGKIPTGLTLNFTGTNTRTGVRVSSNGGSNGSWTVTGFNANNYSIDGTFERTEVNTEIGGTRSYSSTHEWTFSGILVDKTTRIIQGGTVTYTMAGILNGTTNFSHSGTITFTGNNSATITVNGNNYTLNLLTGAVVKA